MLIKFHGESFLVQWQKMEEKNTNRRKNGSPKKHFVQTAVFNSGLNNPDNHASMSQFRGWIIVRRRSEADFEDDQVRRKQHILVGKILIFQWNLCASSSFFFLVMWLVLESPRVTQVFMVINFIPALSCWAVNCFYMPWSLTSLFSLFAFTHPPIK